MTLSIQIKNREWKRRKKL